jgi:tetratricopeptide (TPR) repeat protein
MKGCSLVRPLRRRMSLIPLLALLAAGASGQTADQLYRQGKYEEAASAYRQLVQDTPNSAEALAGLGRCLLQLRRANEAVVYLARAVQLQPASVEMKQALARAYLDTGNAGAAQGLIEFLDQSDPHNAGTLFLLGEWMYRGGFYERASQALRESLALHPDNPAARNFYAVSLAKSGHLAEAEAALKQLLESHAAPADLDVLLTYVQLLDEGGRAEEAQPYAETAVREHPDNPIARYWQARLLFQSGRLEAADKEAEQSIALSPNLPFARNLLLQIYRKMGRQEDAERQAEWLREYDERLSTRGRQ